MLQTERHADALAHWPESGRHVLAQFDATSIVVYQAYNPSIAAAALAANRLGGGGFSLDRMSWIKPGFLWMMHRSGWASKPSQERVLAFHIRRSDFAGLLAAAVPSSFAASRYPSEDAWRTAVRESSVRLQWDPDHAPGGQPLERRAIQLGLRGDWLRQFARDWPLEIEDITAFVHAQRAMVGTPDLLVPVERAVPLPAEIYDQLGLSSTSRLPV